MRTKNRVAIVGVDLQTTGDDAIREGLRMLAEGTLESAHLIFVVDPKQVIDDGVARAREYEEAALEQGPAKLEKRAHRLAAELGLAVRALSVRGHARLGDPAATLLQMCVDYGADMLIVGTHGRRGLDRWLDGSVAEHVVRVARCPVLVARPTGYGGLAKTALPAPPPAPDAVHARGPQRQPATHASKTLDASSRWDNAPSGSRRSL